MKPIARRPLLPTDRGRRVVVATAAAALAAQPGQPRAQPPPEYALLEEARLAREVLELPVRNSGGGSAAAFRALAELARHGEGRRLSAHDAARLAAGLATAVDARAAGETPQRVPFAVHTAFAFRRGGAPPVLALFCRPCQTAQLARELPDRVDASPLLPTSRLDDLLADLSATYRQTPRIPLRNSPG